jgi:ribosomal protein S18 acetylase RimI-like enzyme
MELPVAPQSYRPMPEALVRALQQSEAVLARMAADEMELDGATVFTNPRRPGIYMNNFATEVRVPPGATPEAIVDQILAHYVAAGTLCYFLQSATLQWPADLAQGLETCGYRRGGECAAYLLQQYTPPQQENAELQIIPARAAVQEALTLHRLGAVHEWDCDAKTADDLAAAHLDQFDEPRLEPFLGRLNGRPAGLVYVLGMGQIGIITDVFTAPEFRGRGVAGRLLDHAIQHCARAQYAQVILEARRDNDAACRLYESLGFRYLTGYREYLHPAVKGE